MNQRLQLGLLSAALLCVVPLSAPAQTGRPASRISHVPIQGDFSPDAADAYLNNRLQERNTAELLDKMAKDPDAFGVSDEEKGKLAKALQSSGGQPDKLRNNPDVQRIVHRIASAYAKEGNADPEIRKRLNELSKQIPPPPMPASSSNIKPPDVNTGNPASPGGNPEKPQTDPDRKSSDPGDQIRPNNNPNPARTTPAATPSPSSPAKKDVQDIAEWLADSRLGQSPAFRRMIMNLDRIHVPEGAGGADWDRRLERIGDRLSKLGSHLPDFSQTRFSAAPRGPGRHYAPTAAPTDPGEGGRSLLIVLISVAVGALFLWAVLRRPALGLLRRTAEAAWQLGPWPVRPEAVRTRDELVRAFEYLAFLRFGLAARSRNHREIADNLAEQDSAHRAAAERLAGLYEQARYAPPDEALPDAEMAAARTDLSLLAGVAAA